MKKLLSLVLALALALPLSVTAFATGDTSGDTGTGTTTQGTTIQPGTNGEPSPSSGDTQVNYSVAPAYTVTIPTSVTIDSTNKSGTATVSASGVKVAKGKQVEVKLTGINVTQNNAAGDSEFKVTTAENAALKYTVKIGTTDITTAEASNTVLTVNPESATTNDGASDTASLTFALAEGEVVKYAGTYTGTVTFTVSVEDVPTGNNP